MVVTTQETWLSALPPVKKKKEEEIYPPITKSRL